MSEKMWGKEPFWGLGFEWDPQWVLTDHQKELQAKLIELCASDMRANAVESDKKLMYPRKNFQLLAKHGFLGLHRAEGTGRHGREPRRRRHGGRNHRPLRLPVDGHVLHDASGRRRRGAVPPSQFQADPGHHAPHRQGLPGRHAVLFRPGDRLAFLVPDLLRRRGGEGRLEGAQEGVLDDLGRLRRLVHRPDHQSRTSPATIPTSPASSSWATRSRPIPRTGTAWACAATSRARSRSTRPSRRTAWSARSATARSRTTNASTPSSCSARRPAGTASRWR